MTAVKRYGRIIKHRTYRIWGTAKLVVFANTVGDNHMAGHFHGVGEAGVIINVEFQVLMFVKRAFRRFVDGTLMYVAKTVENGLQDYSYRSISWANGRANAIIDFGLST